MSLPIPSWLNLPTVAYNPLPLISSIVTTNASLFMICALVKDEDLYIDEWLEYHKFLGFTYVAIHDNAENASAVIAELPYKYPDFVSVVHSPGLKHQLKVYDSCIHTFQNTSTWTAFIDVDEFIVLRKHSSIQDYVTDVAPHGGAVALNRDHFTSHHQTKYSPEPVLSRFVSRKVKPDERVKTIAYMPHTQHSRGHHCTLLSNGRTVDAEGRNASATKNYLKHGSTAVAGVNHYFTKSYEEFKLKRYRGFGTHSELNSWYTKDKKGEDRINWDWNDSEKSNGPTMIDTFAWDFYKQMKGPNYGMNFTTNA